MTKEGLKKKYESPSIEIVGGETNNTENIGGNKYSLPYGLCKGEGINTDGMRPREAWEAWMSKTGKTKAQAEKEHWGKTAKEKDGDNSSNGIDKGNAKEYNEAKSNAVNEESNEDHTFVATRGQVSEDYAQRGYEARSFSDYKKGSATASYNASVSRFEKNVNDLINTYKNNKTLTEKDWEDVQNIADRYATNLSKYTDDTNRNASSYPSWFIAGPAKYNVRKNERLLAREMSLYQENERKIDPDDNIYLRKIKAILSNASIKSDDDNAVAKLQEKYDRIKAEVEQGKLENAYFRKHGTLVGCPNVSDTVARAFDKTHKEEPYWGAQPYMPYKLQNSNAEMRRIKGRIDALNTAKANQEAMKNNPELKETMLRYPKVDGVEVEENADAMRIQLRFDNIPSAEVRSKLKHSGFRWSPSQNAWQRNLNENGRFAVRSFLKDMGGE